MLEQRYRRQGYDRLTERRPELVGDNARDGLEVVSVHGSRR